jgi:hypothetical protein
LEAVVVVGGDVKIGWPVDSVVFSRVVFGGIVTPLGFALAPEDVELFLAHTVPDPVVAHVDGLGAALFDGVVGDTAGGAVVGDDDCGGLRMVEFVKADA